MSEPEAGTILLIPLTSNLQVLKYPHTVEMPPSLKNGLSASSVALVFQLRAIDISRLRNRIGFAVREAMAEIDGSARDLLGL